MCFTNQLSTNTLPASLSWKEFILCRFDFFLTVWDMKQLSQLQQPLINHTVFSSAQVSHLFLTQTFLNPTETQITVAMATPLLSTPQPFCSASVVNDLSLVASRWTRSHTWGTQPLCDSWLTSMSTQPAWFPLKVSHSWPPHPVVAFCNDSQSGQGPPIIESTRSLTKKCWFKCLTSDVLNQNLQAVGPGVCSPNKLPSAS